MAIRFFVSLPLILMAAAGCGPVSGKGMRSNTMALKIDPRLDDLKVNFSDEGRASFTYSYKGVERDVIMPYEVVRNQDKLIWLRGAGDEPLIVGQVNDGYVDFCDGPYEAVCDFSFSLRLPGEGNSDLGNPDEPVANAELAVRPSGDRSGHSYTELLDYIIPSPNQLDAGSCLFMSSIGAAEIINNKAKGIRNPKPGTRYDYSERMLMNSRTPSGGYWLIDAVLNVNRGVLLSTEYPFTMAYLKKGTSGKLLKQNGRYVVTNASDSRAQLSAQVNWNDDFSSNSGLKDKMVETTPVDREAMYLDKDRNVWNVAVMGEAQVNDVKSALLRYRAPVIAVYNHYGYWHAVDIVGFDDEASTDCTMPKDFAKREIDKGDPSGYGKRVKNAIEKHGCRSKGVFYVRDSIQSSDLPYEYGGAYKGSYSTPYVVRSYDWLRFLGNHTFAVYRKRPTATND